MSLRPSQPRLEESYYTVVFPGDSDIVFESSLPSTSSISPPPRSATYLGDLSRKHNAVAQITREEPASPLRSQGEDSDEEAALAAREERINTLRNQVQDALAKADGNPADGKWAFLTHLLRMGVTSGRSGRWFGVRDDLKPPEALEGPGLGWMNAKTGAEWKEWEKRYQEERRVKDKVERWKKQVQPPSKGPSLYRSLDTLAGDGVSPVAAMAVILPQQPTPNRVVESTTATNLPESQSKAKVTLRPAGSMTSAPKPTPNALTSAAQADPLKDAAPFGFNVVKRLKTTAVGKPTPPSGKPEPELNGAHSSKAKELPGFPKKTVDDANKSQTPVVPASTRDTNIRHIADLPDLSFLPPSFPSSQMVTSTPKAAAKPPSKARKPDPILPKPASPSSFDISISNPAAKPSSLLPSSSPLVTKTYGRHNQGSSPSPRQPLETSASLPAIPTPSTPIRNVRDRNTNDLNPTKDDNIKNTNNKRIFPSPATPGNANNDHERALKKARTISSLDGLIASPLRNRGAPQQILTAFPRPRSPRTPTAARGPGGGGGTTGAGGSATPGGGVAMTSSPLSPPPSTPLNGTRNKNKKQVPTLTELLASAKREKGKGKKKAVGGGPVTGVSKPASKVMPAAIPEEEHTGHESPVARTFPSVDVDAQPVDAPVYGYDIGTAFDDDIPGEEVNRYLLDPYAAIDVVQDPHFDHPDLDVEIDFSPTKSLSSLAGSDSEDEHDEPDHLGMGMGMGVDFSFRPLVTSTQRGPFGGPDPSANDDSVNVNNINGDGSHSGMNHETGASSQITKDSWASVYAPGSAPDGSGAPPLAPSSSNPLAAPGASAGSNYNNPYTSYNSQFDSAVARQVDKVDKLLEKELDYEGWLRDPSEEREGEGSGGGFGQNSLGRGNANANGVEESP